MASGMMVVQLTAEETRSSVTAAAKNAASQLFGAAKLPEITPTVQIDAEGAATVTFNAPPPPATQTTTQPT